MSKRSAASPLRPRAPVAQRERLEERISVLRTRRKPTCAICLRTLPGDRRQPHVCAPADVSAWSAELGMIVQPETRVCADCWQQRKQLPRWSSQIDPSTRSAAAQERTQPADAAAMAAALRTAWQRIVQLQQRVHQLETDEVAHAAEAASVPARAAAPDSEPAAAPVQLASPAQHSFFDILLGNDDTLRAFTGAPSRAEFDELCDDLHRPPLPAWTATTVSLPCAVLMALCHLRLHIPMRAFPGLFGCAIGTAYNVAHAAMRRLHTLATSQRARGAVRFLSDEQIAATLPERVWAGSGGV